MSRLPLRAASVAVALLVTLAGPGLALGGPAQAARQRAPLPAGRYPSTISKMVCSPKAQRDISEVLGEPRPTVRPPTWVGHLYSCHYDYAGGTMVLSVKELSSWAQTKSYFRVLGAGLGRTRSLGGLGQGAFTTRAGWVVVRNDYKILTVDIAGLPPQFGRPPTRSADVAVTVADVILGCWNGD